MKRLVPLLMAGLVVGASTGAILAGNPPSPGEPRFEGRPPVTVTAPMVGFAGRAAISLEAFAELPSRELAGPLVDPGSPTSDQRFDPRLLVEIQDEAGQALASAELEAGGKTTVVLDLPRGTHRLRAVAPGQYAGSVDLTLRVIPGWTTVLPAALAILLALVLRQVIPALVAGVVFGAWLAFGGIVTPFLRTVDRYLVMALSDSDHISIVIFSMFLGGMVGVITRSGGTAGLVEALRPYATTGRRGQLVTWVLGLLVFFDDYANTLVVGNTMRPVTDRLRISREKLAYIVDSTAAPVAAIFLVSTWIGYEVSLIDEALQAVGSEADAYSVFLQAIPYNFYPILALVFGFMVASSGRDFGPMRRAEARAVAGKLMSDTAVPLSDFDGSGLSATDNKPRHWINAAVPVAVVIVVTFASLWLSGRHSLIEAGDPRGTAGLFSLGASGIGSVLGSGNSYHALLYGSAGSLLAAILMAVVPRVLTLGQALDAMLRGFKSMIMAFVILTLAWSISQVCTDLDTSGYMVSALSDKLDPRILPTLVFVLSAVTAFATGSSWSTMGILIPLAVPTSYGMAQAAGYDPAFAHAILLGAVASVLAGAIFGDHCSPISDTTVLSSMASGCDHLDHVRTQLPYALTVGVVGMLLGSLPAGFGVSPWICLIVAAAALALVVRLAGKTTRAEA